MAAPQVWILTPCQVEGATTFGTLSFGGSTATTVSFVVGRPQ